MVERLSGLEFLCELGRGSMGQVMLARQLPEEMLVAVKRLGDVAQIGSVQQARLRREARALSRLHHRHVVRLIDLLQIGEELLLVLEYIDGPSLAQLQANVRVARADGLAMVSQMQGGLHHAHAVGVVHRDVKPSNVLLASDGRCTLTDFGLAQLDDIASHQRTVLTRPGTPVGTAQYISPEAAVGDVELDARSDIYSLGVVIYELLLGRLPFPAEMGTLGLLHAHMTEPVPRPRAVDPDFPSGVEEVLVWALEKDRDRRPSSVGQLWDGLAGAAAAAWPDWWVDADLRSLAASVPARTSVPALGPGPAAPRHMAPGDQGGWPWEHLDFRRIEPTLPQLHRPSRAAPLVRWLLLGLVLGLGAFLAVRALAH